MVGIKKADGREFIATICTSSLAAKERTKGE